MKPHFVLIFFIAAASLILQTSCTSLNTEAECLKSGKAHYEKEQYDKAIKDYTRAIELKPDDAEMYVSRGNAYFALKQYDKAIQDYSLAIKLNPDDTVAYNNRGTIFFELKQYDRAIIDYFKAIELNPDDADAYNNRGNAFSKLKQYDKAIIDYSKAIELNPDNANTYYNQAHAYLLLKQYDKAIIDYSQVIKLNPDDVDAYCNRAYAYLSLKQYDKAIIDYSRVIELKPDRSGIYSSILEVCNITSKPEQFNKWLKQFETAIPEGKLSKDSLLIKLYLVCLNKCIRDEPRTEIENRLEALLKEKIELNWSFELTDEWLDNPKNGLTPEQIKYIRNLTDKIKASQKK